MKASNSGIRESKRAMESVIAVLTHAGIDYAGMTLDEMIDSSRSITARCRHDYDRPYKGHGTRVCKKCGGLQDN